MTGIYGLLFPRAGANDQRAGIAGGERWAAGGRGGAGGGRDCPCFQGQEEEGGGQQAGVDGSLFSQEVDSLVECNCTFRTAFGWKIMTV